MRYTARPKKRSLPKRIMTILIVGLIVVVAATVIARETYNRELGPANSANQQTQEVIINQGEAADTIAVKLKNDGLIRSSWAFELYVSSLQERGALEAGTYDFSPSQSVQEIVAQLTHGKVAANLVTILPGQTLNQIEKAFENDGYSASDLSSAFDDPTQYANEPVMSIKPASTSLEGMLYPDSFQKDQNTSLQDIVRESLDEMDKQLTPSIRQAFAAEGLTPYQGLILASIVEAEVSSQSDRNQVAQVFLARLAQGMPLGSDVTANYGSIEAGQPESITYDSPYNTLLHKGLPPSPIGTVSVSSLSAVAHPAKTSWLYFVTGDNGTTYFSQTLAQHQAYTAQYCHKLCSQ